jgi:hypothetical protein
MYILTISTYLWNHPLYVNIYQVHFSFILIHFDGYFTQEP